MNKTHLEINCKALEANYKLLASKISSDCEIIGVVKANAYGTDAVAVARELIKLGVKQLAVAYIEEGVRLRAAGIDIPILIFYPQPDNFDLLLDHDLTPSVYSFFALKKLKLILQKQQIENFGIHIKINSGMNRLGFELDELESLKNQLNDKRLKIGGVFSHFSAAGSPVEKEFTNQQINQYQKAVDFFKHHFSTKILFHLSSSSGIMNYPKACYNAVRAGIALYGYGNHPQEDRHLQPVAQLYASIIQLRTIKTGESVGYDRAFIAKKTCKIATLSIGYADGISRIYGNGCAIVNINGKMATTCGNICMDTMMVDVSHIDCQEGDLVKIFGDNHPATSFDTYQQSIAYELITRISERVPRIIKK